MSSQASWPLYKRIFKYVAPYRKRFIAALICMVFFGATDGGVPFLMKYVLDKVFTPSGSQYLWFLPIVIIVFAVFRGACDFGQQYLISSLGHKVVHNMRDELNKHLLKLEPGYFIKHSSAELLSRVTSDVLMMRTLVTDTAAAVIRDSIRLVALVAATVYLDPWLALLSLVVFPIAGFPIARIGKRMRKLSKRSQDAVGNLSAVLQESMLGSRVVKIFCRERYEEEKFKSENDRLTATLVKSEVIRAAAGPINEVLASMAIAGILLFGGYSVIHGGRTQGDFIAFLVSVFLMYDPFKKLTRVNAVVQQGLASAQRIFEVFDRVPLIVNPPRPIPLSKSSSITLDKVSFVYGGRDSLNALSDIDLEIEEGKKTALVGFSGSGKSTLVDLLPRFIDPTKGRVLLGGVDIKSVDLLELRSRLAMVGQHTFLFHDTILNNVRYGRPDATESEVREAVKSAYALDFINALPQGFNTVVGESGMMLSGGERQRIAIARAILKNAPLLILDEATASLDNRAEREVQMAIQDLEKGRTTIVIAHRLSTIIDSDKIVVMSGGRIAEVGQHQNLLAKQGEYARLHALGFKDHEQSPDSE